MIVIIMGNGVAIFIILDVYNVVFYNYDNSDMISVIMFMLIALAVHAEASENV